MPVRAPVSVQQLYHVLGGGSPSRASPGPPHCHHPPVECIQQLPHGYQVAVSDLLDDGDVVATQDLRTGPR